jgi:hypothetical protein
MEKNTNNKLSQEWIANKTAGKMSAWQTRWISSLVKLAKEFINKGSALPHPELTQDEFAHAQEVSRSATTRPVEVAMSPILKNMLIASGDLKKGQRLAVQSEETRVEKWMVDMCRAGIENLFNAGLPDKYNYELGPADLNHYVVDCVRNIPTSFRHSWVKPKRTLEEAVDAFREPYPKPRLSFFDLITNYPAGQMAMDYLDQVIPRVTANSDFKLTALPFEHRDSNVGLKKAVNARKIVPGTDMTYGQEAVKIAESTPLNKLWSYNGYILFARFQRGSERNIMGSSSVVNSSLNRLASEEVERYKRVELYVGYNPLDVLKTALIRKTEYCEAHGLVCMNFDQVKYDSNIGPEMKAAADAFTWGKATGRLSKEIAYTRGVLAHQGWLITPFDKDWVKVYARVFSGEIETNKKECQISAATNIAASVVQDPDYGDILYKCPYALIALGDDINIAERKEFSVDMHRRLMGDLGLDVHTLEEKGEFGAFFLQHRLIRLGSKYMLVTPFPRVLRSMTFRERPAGLGPAGWTFAFWTMLSNLIEYPEVLTFVVQMLLPFDSMKLGTELTVQELIDMVNKEDEEALAKKPSSQVRTTGDILYDGDPQKAEFFDTSGKHVTLRASPYLTHIQEAVKAAAHSESPAYKAAIAQVPFPQASSNTSGNDVKEE